MCHMSHVTLGRVNFCQKHPNMSAKSFYCVFWCTDQPQKISANSSTPSLSKFEIEFTIEITIGNAHKKQNILDKALSDGPSVNLKPLYNSNMTKVSVLKWSQNCTRTIRNGVFGIPKYLKNACKAGYFNFFG